MKITKQLCLSLGLAALLGACTTTGLSTNPSINSNGLENTAIDDESPVERLTNEEIQAILQPPVTRGASNNWSYGPIKCSATGDISCTNVDLITDEGVINWDDTISFDNETDNHSSYYKFMNMAGKCLTSNSDTIKTADCDINADNQLFRLGFEEVDYGTIKMDKGDTSYTNVRRYNFSVFPKVNYQGNTQTYGSSTNPETYAWKKKDSSNNIGQGGDCANEGSKCVFHFIDVGRVTDSSYDKNYTIKDTDGTENEGELFFLQNERFVDKESRARCMRPHNSKLQQRRDKDKFYCDENDSQMLWAIFKVTDNTLIAIP